MSIYIRVAGDKNRLVVTPYNTLSPAITTLPSFRLDPLWTQGAILHHTTDTLKRVAVTLSHTTDTYKRPIPTVKAAHMPSEHMVVDTNANLLVTFSVLPKFRMVVFTN